MNDDVFDLLCNHLLIDIIAILCLEVVLELLQRPHVAWDVVLVVHSLGVLGNTVVGQVRVSVGQIREAEISCWEPDIVFGVKPDGKRVPVCHDYPLPDIKLPILHDE